MANFDLRNFLTENKLTRASKALSENIEPKKLNKLSLGAKTYQVGDNDPNDEGKITTIEKFKNGYFITGRGPGPKEAYGYALDLKGNEKPGTSKEDLMENKLTRVSKTLIKEAEVGSKLTLLVPTVYFNVETGELSDTPYKWGSESEIKEKDITSYSNINDFIEFVASGDQEEAMETAQE